mgnify:CR=1
MINYQTTPFRILFCLKSKFRFKLTLELPSQITSTLCYLYCLKLIFSSRPLIKELLPSKQVTVVDC